MEWLASGPQAAALASGCRPEAAVSVRAQVVSEFRETLASIGETLAALERRLTGIERQLGITAAAPEEGRRDRTAERSHRRRPLQAPEEAAGARTGPKH